MPFTIMLNFTCVVKAHDIPSASAVPFEQLFQFQMKLSLVVALIYTRKIKYLILILLYTIKLHHTGILQS